MDDKKLTTKLSSALQDLEALKAKYKRLNNSYNELEMEYNNIVNSRAWKIVKLYYRVRDVLLPTGSKRYKVFKAIVKPILKPVFWCFKNIFKPRRKGHSLHPDLAFKKLKNCQRIDIVAVKHTAFVAEILKEILSDNGISCNIHLSEPQKYEDIPYIMICAQNFKHFPKLYMAFQMEQTVNSRWLTREYIDILHNAYAVFDYSMVNIEYFSSDTRLKNKLYYLPIDLSREYLSQNTVSENKEYDVVFYGDPNIKRRQEFLYKIGERFNLKVISNSFGEALYEELSKAKIVVNVHYYENALLETTRLYEALSRSDCLIVSERSCDTGADKELENIVDFTPIGDIDAMISRIEYWLSNEDLRQKKVRSNLESLKTKESAANFYLLRFLLANDRLSFAEFYKAAGAFIHFDNDRICLSIPECIARRDAFVEDNKFGFNFFPALRHKTGWIGCGMSYKFILKKAAEQKLSRILVCEDDVYFPPDFEDKFNKILEFLDKNGDWNVFSGIMADVGRVKILKHENADGIDLVYLNRMISMVFNMYDGSVFELIANWDETNHNVDKNAVDRYLEDKNLRVVTSCPFLVGHKEDLSSTIWGKGNNIYTNLIAESSKKLENMLKDYKEN